MLGVLRAARGRGGSCARPSEQFPVLRARRVGLPPSRLSSFKIPTAAMHIDDLDLTQIKLVAELLRHRSVSAASLSIGLSQSAACHALANLRTQPAIPSPFARVAVSNQSPMESGVVLRRRVARRVASWPYFKPTLRTGNEFEALQYLRQRHPTKFGWLFRDGEGQCRFSEARNLAANQAMGGSLRGRPRL